MATSSPDWIDNLNGHNHQLIPTQLDPQQLQTLLAQQQASQQAAASTVSTYTGLAQAQATGATFTTGSTSGTATISNPFTWTTTTPSYHFTEPIYEEPKQAKKYKSDVDRVIDEEVRRIKNL